MRAVAAGRVLVPLAIAPRAPVRGARVHALAGRTMGTTWSLRFVAAAGPRTATVAAAVQHELDDVVAQMSHWEEGSDLSRFNRAGAGRSQVLPESFSAVLRYGLAVARDSGGAFDPCAGALVDAWGFGARGRFADSDFHPPSRAQIDAARAAGGWQRLQLDTESRRVVQPGGLRLDLSAIAKGHAVDRVATLLQRELGIADALVEVGGELRGSGVKPDGQPWWVDIEAPAPAGAGPPPTRVALHDLAVATSGDYRRFFRHAGQRRAHTIDPRSGLPIAHGLCSVTVLHASCMAADALSTAITVLGPDDGLAFARRHEIAALLVERRDDGGFDERLSPALAALAQ